MVSLGLVQNGLPFLRASRDGAGPCPGSNERAPGQAETRSRPGFLCDNLEPTMDRPATFNPAPGC